MQTSIIVGNLKPASRTLDAAQLLATKLTGRPADQVFDLVEYGAALLDWNDAGIKAAVEEVAKSNLVIVASPTFKATYTGLLKLFLDRFAGQTGMQGVVAIPLMLGAGERHALAVEIHLKPVLAEIGATCPTAGLYLNDKTYAEGPEMDHFVAAWKPAINLLVAARGGWA